MVSPRGGFPRAGGMKFHQMCDFGSIRLCSRRSQTRTFPESRNGLSAHKAKA
jgi:hypothetical protein